MGAIVDRDLTAGPGLFLSTTQPRREHNRLAATVVVVSLALFAALAPFATVRLPVVLAFVAAYQSALILCDLITAALLVGQYRVHRSRALLVLACGYLFTAASAAVHALTFPGLFTPGGLLGAGPQTTAWLYMYWHAGFPLFVIAYAVSKDRPVAPASGGGVPMALGAAVAAIAGAAAVIWLSMPEHDLLPAIMSGHHYTPAMAGVVTSVWLLSAGAALVLWRRRPHSVLDLWLMVVMCAWTLDIALSAVVNAGRFDLGFYAGRTYGLAAAMLVLVAILLEYGNLAARLERLNESLERGIAARTTELDAARARLAGIIDSAMDAIITVDERHQVVLFNKAAESIFGYSAHEVIGGPLARLIPERFRAGHDRDMDRFAQAGSAPRRMSARRVVAGLRRGGVEFPIDASISHVALGGHRLYTVVLRDVTERVMAEEAVRRSKDELHEMAVMSATAQEHEKRRVAREIHDELGQALAALKMDIDWLRQHTQPGAAAQAARLASMKSLVDGTVSATRRIASDLRPLMLDDLGLVSAVQWLAANFEQRHRIACKLVVDPPEFELGDPQASTVFRIIQESLTNVARHARASKVVIELRRTASEIHLEVSDDGVGFDTAKPRRADAFGVMGLRERTYLAGGTIEIESAPGRGTLISVDIPLEARSVTPLATA